MGSSLEALGELERSLSGGTLLTDPDVMEPYRFDRSNDVSAGKPLAVVRAKSTADVSALCSWASRNNVPLVPRGAGTGLAGGSLPSDGSVVCSLEQMRNVTIEDQLAIAEPGALNGEVKRAARAKGLWYPPDPSSFEICSIGGNVATNAGGACCVKYGVTSDYVIGLEVVLADGRVLRLGGRTIKDVAGYDLKRLFVGSEGTLGIVTEVTLRLAPTPPPAVTMVSFFNDVAAAGRAVTMITSLVRPAGLELMDATSIRAVESVTQMGLDTSAGALLLGRSDAGGERGTKELAEMERACREEGASDIYSTDDEEEGEQFMAARRMAFPAIERLGTAFIEDVGVPLTRTAELLGSLEEIAARNETIIATVGHAGDGNFHPLVVFDRRDPESLRRAETAFSEVMELAGKLGGTITGEHGVGILKRDWLPRQLGEDVLQLERGLKGLFDPQGILNPGKVI